MTNREQDKTAPKAGAAPGSEDRDASRDAAGEVQGEGNYEASRRHQRAASRASFSVSCPAAKSWAAPRSAEEKAELERAEREGRAHAAGDEEDLDISDDEPPAIQRGNE